LCPNWKKKLISVSTDGASNMHGRYQGFVPRLDQVFEQGFIEYGAMPINWIW